MLATCYPCAHTSVRQHADSASLGAPILLTPPQVLARVLILEPRPRPHPILRLPSPPLDYPDDLGFPTSFHLAASRSTESGRDITVDASGLTLCETDDRAVIEAFLRRDAPIHLYELGDLDPFFWPKTRWFGAWRGGELEALALQYAAPGVDALLLVERQHPASAIWLGRKLVDRQEAAFHSHFSAGIGPLFEGRNPRCAGVFTKMTLAADAALPPPRHGVRRLTEKDLGALTELYEQAYPGNWFDPAMLQTRQYFGGFDGRRLQAVAGVHVFAPTLGVAALGNITTHPSARGKGWARSVTGAVCSSLREEGVSQIGLNVRADNAAAIACYVRLGFSREADYEEWDVDAR